MFFSIMEYISYYHKDPIVEIILDKPHFVSGVFFANHLRTLFFFLAHTPGLFMDFNIWACGKMGLHRFTVKWTVDEWDNDDEPVHGNGVSV